MDWSAFLGSALNGSPITLVVLGLVTWYGKLGISGKWQLVASMGTGLVLGVCYQIAMLGVPATFAGWFANLIYGLFLGLIASGIYETGKHLAEKSKK